MVIFQCCVYLPLFCSDSLKLPVDSQAQEGWNVIISQVSCMLILHADPEIWYPLISFPLCISYRCVLTTEGMKCTLSALCALISSLQKDTSLFNTSKDGPKSGGNCTGEGEEGRTKNSLCLWSLSPPPHWLFNIFIPASSGMIKVAYTFNEIQSQ